MPKPMKPKKVTIESEADERKKHACDLVIERAAHMMVGEIGAPIGMMLDRMLTYAGAQSCAMEGSPATARIFRQLADNIDAGAFHQITGEGTEPKGRH